MRVLILGLLSLMLGHSVCDAEEAGHLRTMSYNIRYANPRDGESRWQFRKDAVAKLVVDHGIDVIGLQEVLKPQLDDLRQRLPGYEAVGVGRDDGKTKGEYSPILYRKNKLQLLESRTMWLSKTPKVPGSKDWDAAITRIVTLARFQVVESEQEFWFLNTHFDHRGAVAREKSASLIRDVIADLTKGGMPLVLTGDMNALPESKPIMELLRKSPSGSQLSDSRMTSRSPAGGPDSTWCGFTKIVPNRRIDYVFITEDVVVHSHQTVVDRIAGSERYPSDHLPVSATISF